LQHAKTSMKVATEAVQLPGDYLKEYPVSLLFKTVFSGNLLKTSSSWGAKYICEKTKPRNKEDMIMVRCASRFSPL